MLRVHPELKEHALEKLREFVAERLGLHYPEHRSSDLEKGFRAACGDLGVSNPVEYAEALLKSKPDPRTVDALARNLTIGETYFFREQRSVEVLEQTILPELIRTQRLKNRELRIWSAGCCTGEEPYSLAISLRKLLPDIQNWKIDLLATDVNPVFLKKAAAGLFTEWSFRRTDAAFRQQYFRQVGDRHYAIAPEIKRMVRFVQVNLAEPFFTGVAAGMDLILCRNVLIYFAPDALARTLKNFHKTLSRDGWFLVGPSEGGFVTGAGFKAVRFPGFCAYQRDDAHHRRVGLADSHGTGAASASLIADYQPEPPSAYAYLEPHHQNTSPRESKLDFPALARSAADEGRLDEALALCNQALEADKSATSIHYLRASVLSEKGLTSDAISGFKRALYLDPDFILAHFALGNLYRGMGDARAARKYFENAQGLLKSHDANEVLAEADGLSVRRLSEIITALMEQERGA